jgi:hypothetical protein
MSRAVGQYGCGCSCIETDDAARLLFQALSVSLDCISAHRLSPHHAPFFSRCHRFSQQPRHISRRLFLDSAHLGWVALGTWPATPSFVYVLEGSCE